MKKIGIITFHRAKNYGAVLQAYALQHTLEQLGSDCEIVDYKCENIDNGYKPFQFNKADPIKSILKSIVMYRKRAQRIERFSSFYNNYLKISDKTYSDLDISECRKLYNAFISGSDQVWGPGKDGVSPDTAYFLSFADNNQKYSYAASFGVSDISDVKAKELRPLLENFRSFSVREKSALNIIKKITGKNGLCHIDPTLLLKGGEWQKISVNKTDKPYILVFNVKPVKSLIDFAEKLSKEKGLPVIYITDNPQKKRENFTYVSAPTVEEFLGYFANAEYTVTNSFHGTAFSVIFHRNMFVEYETARGFNDRAKNLLQTVGINREIKDGEAVETNIDWNKVDEILQAERKLSLDYLKNITEEV